MSGDQLAVLVQHADGKIHQLGSGAEDGDLVVAGRIRGRGWVAPGFEPTGFGHRALR